MPDSLADVKPLTSRRRRDIMPYMPYLEAYLRQCKARAEIKETISDEQFRLNFEALSTSLGVAAMRDPVVYGLARVFSARVDFDKETCLVAMVRQLVENKRELCEMYADLLNKRPYYCPAT